MSSDAAPAPSFSPLFGKTLSRQPSRVPPQHKPPSGAKSGLRTWHVGTLFAREPGALLPGRFRSHERSASGRRGVEADEVRAGEVRPLHNSIEADEQTWATGGGVGGAKGEDRGKHGRATHVPDTAPDKRDPEARLCTRSCSWDSSLTTRGGSPVRESRPPGSVRGASSGFVHMRPQTRANC